MQDLEHFYVNTYEEFFFKGAKVRSVYLKQWCGGYNLSISIFCKKASRE